MMYEKTLVRIGNSIGVVIDRPILRLLGIGTRAVLRIWTDGRRIVIEPTGTLVDERPTAQASPIESRSTDDRSALEIDATAVVLQLGRNFGMSREEFAELHHCGMRLSRYTAWTQDGIPDATPAELQTVRRVKFCRDRLCAGDDMRAAIDAALVAFPIEAG